MNARGSRKPSRDAAIVEMARNATLSIATIAEHFGVSVTTVGLVLRRAGQQRKWGRLAGPADVARDAEVRRMRDSGMTLQAIGDQLGVCRERIGQIVKRTGTTFQPRKPVVERNREIREKVGTVPVAILAREYGLSEMSIYAISRGMAKVRSRATWERNREIVRRVATESIVDLAREYGISPAHVYRICVRGTRV